MSSTVCTDLLTSNAESYKSAVTHRFLKRVAEQTATKSFETWLSQDLHFVLGYLKVLALVLSRLPAEGNADRLESDIFALTTALSSISDEASFFRAQAAAHNIPLSYTAGSIGPVTKKYVDYLTKLATEGSFGEVLVAVWAAEKIYLDSWTYAAESTPLNRQNKYQKFINHWTKPEFAAFVAWLEGFTNDATGSVKPEFERVFQTVIQLEIEFWDAAIAAEE
ncbi:hypothetical protein HK104_011472 [Borealophlyctis nickersoniae]|nr:hypothetical protein HK104_011472 [Borealophlyctis nickersoniae]